MSAPSSHGQSVSGSPVVLSPPVLVSGLVDVDPPALVLPSPVDVEPALVLVPASAVSPLDVVGVLVLPSPLDELLVVSSPVDRGSHAPRSSRGRSSGVSPLSSLVP